MMRCQRCNKPMKERLLTDEFLGDSSRVLVTGIRAGICSYCGHQAADPNMLEEIEMFVKPLLGGGMGMHLLDAHEVTIDLGHSMHPSAIDIAGPSVQHQNLVKRRFQPSDRSTDSVAIAEAAA